MALLGSLLLFFGITACKTKPYSTSELPTKRIIFGSGGGFTGAVTEYHLFENGQLFEKQPMLSDTLRPLPNMERKVCRKAFKKMEKMDTSLLGANQPGNRYYFLEWNNGERAWRTVWGSSSYKVANEVKDLYQQLIPSKD